MCRQYTNSYSSIIISYFLLIMGVIFFSFFFFFFFWPVNLSTVKWNWAIFWGDSSEGTFSKTDYNGTEIFISVFCLVTARCELCRPREFHSLFRNGLGVDRWSPIHRAIHIIAKATIRGSWQCHYWHFSEVRASSQNTAGPKQNVRCVNQKSPCEDCFQL